MSERSKSRFVCVFFRRLQYRLEMLRITYFIATIIQMTKYREYFSCFWWIGTRENDILWHCYIPSWFNVKCTTFFILILFAVLRCMTLWFDFMFAFSFVTQGKYLWRLSPDLLYTDRFVLSNWSALKWVIEIEFIWSIFHCTIDDQHFYRLLWVAQTKCIRIFCHFMQSHCRPNKE